MSNTERKKIASHWLRQGSSSGMRGTPSNMFREHQQLATDVAKYFDPLQQIALRYPGRSSWLAGSMVVAAHALVSTRGKLEIIVAHAIASSCPAQRREHGLHGESHDRRRDRRCRSFLSGRISTTPCRHGLARPGCGNYLLPKEVRRRAFQYASITDAVIKTSPRDSGAVTNDRT